MCCDCSVAKWNVFCSYLIVFILLNEIVFGYAVPFGIDSDAQGSLRIHGIDNFSLYRGISVTPIACAS